MNTSSYYRLAVTTTCKIYASRCSIASCLLPHCSVQLKLGFAELPYLARSKLLQACLLESRNIGRSYIRRHSLAYREAYSRELGLGLFSFVAIFLSSDGTVVQTAVAAYHMRSLASRNLLMPLQSFLSSLFFFLVNIN